MNKSENSGIKKRGRKIREKNFFTRSAKELAPDLVGKYICTKDDSGNTVRLKITETEIYMGEDDGACHARHGKTDRTAPMYENGGITYIYLVYGMHWLLNIVSGKKNEPEAVLVRACETANGPGKLTKALGIDSLFKGESFLTSQRIWLEDIGEHPKLRTDKRVGIDYAEPIWRDKLWRFIYDE